MLRLGRDDAHEVFVEPPGDEGEGEGDEAEGEDEGCGVGEGHSWVRESVWCVGKGGWWTGVRAGGVYVCGWRELVSMRLWDAKECFGELGRWGMCAGEWL